MKISTDYSPDVNLSPEIPRKSSCQYPPCEGHPNCHAPDEILQYPFGTPLSPKLVQLKKLIEQNDSPEEVMQLFNQLEPGNIKNVDCEMSMKTSTDLQPNDFPPSVLKSITSNCRVPPCEGHPGCHSPDDILQYPFGTPLPPNLVHLKKVIEQDDSLEKVMQLFNQLEGGNMNNVDCKIPMKNSTGLQPNDYSLSVSKSTPTTNCQIAPCEDHPGCHSPDEVLQYPFGTPLSPSALQLKKLIEQNESPEKVKQLFGQFDARNIHSNTCEMFVKKSTDLQPNDSAYRTNKAHRFLPHQEHLKYHSQDELLQHPTLETHLSPFLAEVKKLIEQKNNSNKVKGLIEQIEADNLENINWEKLTETPKHSSPVDFPTSGSVPKSSSFILSPCHSPDDLLQFPCGTPLPPHLVALKNILERSYDPQKVKRLFEQIEAGDLNNLDWREALRTPKHIPNPQRLKATCHDPTCHTHPCCYYPEELIQYPHGTPLPAHLNVLKNIVGQKHDPHKVRQLFGQIESGHLNNLDWEGAQRAPTCCSAYEIPNPRSVPTSSDCQDPSYPKPHCTSLSQQLLKLKKLLKHYKNLNTCNLNNVDCVEAVKFPTNFSPDIYSTSQIKPTISACQIPPCRGHPGCHLPNDINQYPFGTTLPQQLIEFKKLLDQNIDPKKMKRLFAEIEAGSLEDLDLETAMEILASLPANEDDDETEDMHPSVAIPPGLECRIPPCTGRPGCHSPDEVLQYPFGTPLPKQLKELKKLLEENCSPETVSHLFKQIEAGNLKDFKSVGCGEAEETPVVTAPEVWPPSVSTATDYRPNLKLPVVSRPGVSQPRFPQSEVSVPRVLQPGVSQPRVSHPGVSQPVFSKPGVSQLETGHVVVVIPPEVYAPAPKDEDCAVCHKPKYRNGVKLKCACSGKKKTVKIKPPCPCEVHKAPIAKEEPGFNADLKIATRSIGDQCCICDEYNSGVKETGQNVIYKLGQTAPSVIGTPCGPVSTGIQGGIGCLKCPSGLPCTSENSTCPKLSITTISPIPMGFFGQPDMKSEMGELDIIGPQGGYVIIGPGGIHTQAGTKQIRISSGVATDPDFSNVGAESTDKTKKNCLCFGKRKKKRKIVCQCPSESDQEPLLLYTYEDFEEARKQSKIHKSNLTQTTSGFKFNKKKAPEPTPEPEYTMEDAIRDYALMRPDFIREICPPGVTRKGRKKDCACEDDKGVGNYEILKKDKQGNFVLEKPEELPPKDEGPRGGLKLSIGGKGSGSKGLSGICCFEMYQDS